MTRPFEGKPSLTPSGIFFFEMLAIIAVYVTCDLKSCVHLYFYKFLLCANLHMLVSLLFIALITIFNIHIFVTSRCSFSFLRKLKTSLIVIDHSHSLLLRPASKTLLSSKCVWGLPTRLTLYWKPALITSGMYRSSVSLLLNIKATSRTQFLDYAFRFCLIFIKMTTPWSLPVRNILLYTDYSVTC